MAPFFAPKIMPAIVVKKNCNVNGQTGMGTLIKAPTIINTVNNAHCAKSRKKR